MVIRLNGIGIHFCFSLKIYWEIVTSKNFRLTSMSERLTELSLHFDELSRLRIVDPEVSAKTNDLKEECNDFVNNVDAFQGIANGFINIVDSLAQEVNKEKIRAIGARNLVKSMAKQRDAQEQQLKALLLEKSTELERLRIQHQSLLRTESEQAELLDRLLLNQ